MNVSSSLSRAQTQDLQKLQWLDTMPRLCSIPNYCRCSRTRKFAHAYGQLERVA